MVLTCNVFPVILDLQSLEWLDVLFCNEKDGSPGAEVFIRERMFGNEKDCQVRYLMFSREKEQRGEGRRAELP